MRFWGTSIATPEVEGNGRTSLLGHHHSAPVCSLCRLFFWCGHCPVVVACGYLEQSSISHGSRLSLMVHSQASGITCGTRTVCFQCLSLFLCFCDSQPHCLSHLGFLNGSQIQVHHIPSSSDHSTSFLSNHLTAFSVVLNSGGWIQPLPISQGEGLESFYTFTTFSDFFLQKYFSSQCSLTLIFIIGLWVLDEGTPHHFGDTPFISLA